MALAISWPAANQLLRLCFALALVSSPVLCRAQGHQPTQTTAGEAALNVCPAHSATGPEPGTDSSREPVPSAEHLPAGGALDSAEGATEGTRTSEASTSPADREPEPASAAETPAYDDKPAQGLPLDTGSPQQQADADSAATEDDRHNFADARDGAKLVAANKEARKAAAVLDSDGDTYLKNECKADKWVLFELSQVAKVEEVQISQFELYSSRVHSFELRGRQTHPRHDGIEYGKGLNLTHWWLLGKYNASNTKGTQAFKVVHPAWVKYIQLHFLTHHGSEPVCALNDVRIFGKSAADDLEDRLAMDAVQEDPAASEPEHKAAATEPLLQTNISAPVLNATANHTIVLPSPRAQPDLASVEPQPAGPDSSSGSQPSPEQAGSSPQQQQQQQQPVALAPTVEVVTGPSAVAREAVVLFPSTPGAGPEPAQLPEGPLLLAAPGSQQSLEAALGVPASFGSPAGDVRLPDSLPSNSAGSNKGKHGGSVYDLLIGEIKALKLQHKAYPRAIADLERNVSLALSQLSEAVAALTAGVDNLQTCTTQAGIGSDRLMPGTRSSHQFGDAALGQVYNKREVVLLGIAAMLAGLLLGSHHPSQQTEYSHLQLAVLGLAFANGLAALALLLVEVWREHTRL